MNEIIDQFLLAGHKFMPHMHLKQPGFTYSACVTFTNNKERIQNFKETRDAKHIYRNELDKACFQHDMVYKDFKNLAKRTAFDKHLRDRAVNIAKNPKYDGYKRGLASTVNKFFDKKSEDSGVAMLANNGQLAEELHKPIIINFINITVYSEFKDNIWGAALADMQLISKLIRDLDFYCVLLMLSVNMYDLLL